MTNEVKDSGTWSLQHTVLFLIGDYLFMWYLGGFAVATTCMAVVAGVFGLVLAAGNGLGELQVPKWEEAKRKRSRQAEIANVKRFQALGYLPKELPNLPQDMLDDDRAAC